MAYARRVGGTLLAVAVAGLVGLFDPAAVGAQERIIAIRSGETIGLGSVFWASRSNCKSQLVDILGVDILAGPPGITLAVRKQPVMPRWDTCTGSIPGGVVVATAGTLTERTEADIEFRVRYDTDGGEEQSTHKRRLALYP